MEKLGSSVAGCVRVAADSRVTINNVKILKGKVVGGRVELPPDAAPDGTVVPDGESTFTLSPEEVRELQKSIDQASRGEVVDAWELLEELRH